MKRVLKIIAALLAVASAAAAMRVAADLPADNKAHIEQKYAGWSGVLQACVCSRWQAGGSFVRWLNRCAADFERQRDGVYIEFISCGEDEISGVGEIYSPDMYFFSPGVFPEEQPCTWLSPVCMGGYAWAYNTSLTDESSIHMKTQPDVQPDTAACSYSAATLALMGGTGEAAPAQDQSMDIGLPASANDEDALSRFIAGGIPCLAVSCADIAKLKRLSDAGRGPDWKTTASDGPAFTDQLLYLMIPASLPDDGRDAVLHDFAAFLLSEKCQGYLSDIGALPVCGGSIYPPHSPYAAAEAQLSGREIITPPAFSEYSFADCGDIVRSFFSGGTAAEQAVRDIILKRSVKGG